MGESVQAMEKDHSMELDLEAFEQEIGKEIDALFTPIGLEDDAMGPAEQDVPEAFGFGVSPEQSDSESHASAEPPAVSVAIEQELIEEDVFTAPLVAPEVNAPKAAQAPLVEAPLTMSPAPGSAESRHEEVTKAVEKFEIAYLSLDWDFSEENIRGTTSSLEGLEGYCRGRHETESLYKILRAVLNHLATRPEAIPPQVNEVMRDAQGLLKRMLIAPSNISADDKQQLKSVIARVQAIKQQGLKKDEAPAGSGASKAPSERTMPGMELKSSYSLKQEENADYYRLEHMIEWVEASRTHLNAIHTQLHQENTRLKKVEELCEKKPALVPLANRIAAIRSNIQQQVNALWDRELEWQKRQDWLCEMVVRYASPQMAVAQAAPPVEDADVQTTETPAPAIITERSVEMAQEVQEDVCTFQLGGETYAVSSSTVVKAELVSDKKYAKIQRKGFATLGDFKPFFKNIKTGVFSAWLGLPSGILKSYQFVPIPADVFKLSDPSSTVRSLILLSNGRHHVMVPAESPGIEQLSATIIQTSREAAVSGRIESKTGESIKVLNLEWILNAIYGGETQNH